MRIDINNNQQPIRILQITDTHLGDKPGEELLGMDTDLSLQHVIAAIQAEREPADLLLATGDLSNCGSVASYQRFQQMSGPLASHALWLPGNHDLLSAMETAIGDGEELTRYAALGNWRIIMLDSTIPGEVGGNLAPAEMALLRRFLEESVGYHALVCLHHQPLTIGCDWLDSQQVANGDEFFATLDEFDHVRGIVWGHIHQQVDRERNGVALMASPSSCVQFAPDSAGFRLDRLNPGYRWLELYPDGRIDSAVQRVSGINFDIDYEVSTGY